MPPPAGLGKYYTRRYVSFIDSITNNVGKVIAGVVLIIMITVAYEVISRYFFNKPTAWVWPLNRQLFGVMILFGGSYALLRGAHIRVEILYSRFSPLWLKISKAAFIICFLAFMGTLVWQGGWMAWTSIQNREVSIDVLRFPVYPFKAVFPVAALLFLLQGVAEFLREEDSGDAGLARDEPTPAGDPKELVRAPAEPGSGSSTRGA